MDTKPAGRGHPHLLLKSFQENNLAPDTCACPDQHCAGFSTQELSRPSDPEVNGEMRGGEDRVAEK
jgi:hypothetical protein